MQVRPEQLAAQLARGIAPLYVVTGDEPLLALEAADAVRAAARAAGYSDRKLLSVERSFDWGQLAAAGAAMSLFGDKTFIDLRIPGGKPGKDGAKALEAHAQAAGAAGMDADAATLITLPKLDRAQMNSAWFTALSQHGVTIQAQAIERAALPAWIGERLGRQKQSADRETLNFIANKVEGNLLAAHQEIQKLGLLQPEGKLEFEAVRDAVLNVARYDVFKLSEAWLANDWPRFRRMLDGLKGEGEAPPLVLWAMTDDIRALAKIRRGEKVWKGPRLPLYEAKAKSVRPAQIGNALKHAAAIDRLIKGLRPKVLSDNVWEEFYRLGASLA
ncbi:MAG TPA: DNA polymerase III subunit delta [Burkholderiales bacterium]